jgi:hypothetical protein
MTRPASCKPCGRSRSNSGFCCAPTPSADAAAAKEELKILVQDAGRPETNKLYRTVCRWWNEIEVLIVTGATTGKVEANNTGIIKRTARGYRNPGNYKSVILMRSAVRPDTHPGIPFPANGEAALPAAPERLGIVAGSASATSLRPGLGQPILSARLIRASLVLTSNLAFSRWGEV